MNPFTEEELKLLRRLCPTIDFDHLPERGEVWSDIEDAAGDELMIHGLDEDYYPNEIGKVCESILHKIPIY